MQNAALSAAGLTDWHYQRLPLPPELFEETVRSLPALDFAGINVTIPHKAAALEVADSASEAAAAIGAVNTLSFTGDGIAGENTDAPGFLAALPEAPAGKSVVVLGAGGSARAVVWALREAGAAEIRIWNRTADRAAAMASEFGVMQIAHPQAADILVNCTSVGLPGKTVKDLPLAAELLDRCSLVADLVYRSGGTPLLVEAERRGCAVVDGLEILVRQGAISFTAWTGLEAPLSVMRQAVRQDRPDGIDSADPNVQRPSSPPDGADRAP
jgi:shikimate dehydrogenase